VYPRISSRYPASKQEGSSGPSRQWRPDLHTLGSLKDRSAGCDFISTPCGRPFVRNSAAALDQSS